MIYKIKNFPLIKLYQHTQYYNIISQPQRKLQVYLQSPNLKLLTQTQMPTLKLQSFDILMKIWANQKPFLIQNQLRVPIFNFSTNQYINKSICLPQEIFNQPIRRDLLYRLYDFRRKLNKFTSVKTRNRSMTSGSNKKMRKQKGQGVARMSDKRAPHLWKGGKAHGKKPKIFSYPLNTKIKLKALCVLLTSKLAQGKLKIVNNLQMQSCKTKLVKQSLSHHAKDYRCIFCVIDEKQLNWNFHKGSRNIQQVLVHNSYNVDVLSLFKADKVIISVKGLQELIQNINKSHYVAYRHDFMPKLEQKVQEEEIKWDSNKPYQFKFKILADYLQQFEALKRQRPQLLQRQMKKIRKITI